jgi:hypothetical protein
MVPTLCELATSVMRIAANECVGAGVPGSRRVDGPGLDVARRLGCVDERI